MSLFRFWTQVGKDETVIEEPVDEVVDEELELDGYCFWL